MDNKSLIIKSKQINKLISHVDSKLNMDDLKLYQNIIKNTCYYCRVFLLESTLKLPIIFVPNKFID